MTNEQILRHVAVIDMRLEALRDEIVYMRTHRAMRDEGKQGQANVEFQYDRVRSAVGKLRETAGGRPR